MSDLQEEIVSLEDKNVSGETFIHTMILYSCIKIIEKNEAAIINNFKLVGFSESQITFVNELKEVITHVYEEIEEIPRLINCHIKEAQIKIACLLPYTETLKWFVIGSFAANTRPFNLDDRDIIGLRGLLKIASYYYKLLNSINKEILEIDNIDKSVKPFTLTKPIVQQYIQNKDTYVCRLIVDKNGNIVPPDNVYHKTDDNMGPSWLSIPDNAIMFCTCYSSIGYDEQITIFKFVGYNWVEQSQYNPEELAELRAAYRTLQKKHESTTLRELIIKEYNLDVVV